jgi:predicted  nucleic acid-binding Zn-ribbon protein
MEEEFENHLQNISDPKEQITKAEELAENIKEGLRTEKKTPYPDETDHGVLLRNLMGLYYVGYLPFSLSNVVLAEDPRKKTTLKEEELIAQGLRRYLKTFNFILGYARGLQSKILESTENEKLGVNILSQLSINGLKDFTERAKNLGFKVTDEGLLFPKEAPFIEEGLKANFIEGEKMAEEVRRSYEKEWITKKEKKLEEEKAKYQEELQKVREKLTNLRDVLPKLQEDESPTHKKEPILVYNLNREIEEKEHLIRKLKDSLSYRRNELVRTSAVSFIKRRQLNQEIQDLEGKIASLEGELPSLRKRVKDLQTKIDEASQRQREYRSSSYVEEEIKRLENREKELEERIAGILREQENIASYKKELGE